MDFELQISWQQEKQNVAPSGIRTQHYTEAARFYNHQVANPFYCRVSTLNYASNHSLGLTLEAIFGFSGESNQDLRGGSSPPQPPRYQ